MIKPLFLAGIFTMGLATYAGATDTHIANALSLDMANGGAPGLPCYESEGMWLPGTLQFDHDTLPHGETESQNQQVPTAGGTDCAVV